MSSCDFMALPLLESGVTGFLRNLSSVFICSLRSVKRKLPVRRSTLKIFGYRPFQFARGSLKKITAIYPGSFDPPTNGHLDLIARGSKIFDQLIVAILRNAEKAPLFGLPERVLMLEAMTEGYKNVRVATFDGLMVDYAAKVNADVVLRGIRAISDYEYELQMALMNRKLHPELETVFMMPAAKYSYLSSRLVREIAQLGGSISDLVPEMVEQRIREKLDPAVKLQNVRNPRKRKRG